jgi:hypothetical protein
VREQLQQRPVETGGVQQPDRARVVAELLPRPRLEQLLQRAEAAGQRHEGVSGLGHLQLALVHGVDDAQLLDAAMAQLARDEAARDDAQHLAAGGQRGVGDLAHQAGMAAAVDEAMAALAEGGTERAGGLGVARVGAAARAAIDTE